MWWFCHMLQQSAMKKWIKSKATWTVVEIFILVDRSVIRGCKSCLALKWPEEQRISLLTCARQKKEWQSSKVLEAWHLSPFPWRRWLPGSQIRKEWPCWQPEYCLIPWRIRKTLRQSTRILPESIPMSPAWFSKIPERVSFSGQLLRLKCRVPLWAVRYSREWSVLWLQSRSTHPTHRNLWKSSDGKRMAATTLQWLMSRRNLR